MKKVLSMVLLLAMLAGMFSIGAAAQDYVVDDTFTLGDVNGDGTVSALDALEVAKYLAGAEGADVIRDAADMNADGQVSAYDSLQFRLCLAQARDWSDYEITDGNGQALYNFTIAGNPISTYSLVVPADTDPEDSNAYYAAEMLAQHILIATGYEPKICFGEKSTENAIYFNPVDELSELGLELDLDGYIYEVTDGQVQIYGTRRGNMYAAYEIMEEYLGYRFFNGNETLIYKNRTSDLPEGTYVKRIMPLTFRFVGQSFGRETSQAYYFPRKLNGSQIYGNDNNRYGTLTGPHFINAHSFGWYYRMYTGNKIYEDQGLVWPEGPSLNDRYNAGVQVDELSWQPCFTSEESYNQMFTGLYLCIKMITEEWGTHTLRRESSSMSFSICDNISGYCKCDNCSTIYATNGYAGGSVFIANRAVKDIQEYYPGLKLYLILYDHTIPQDIFPEDDLIIMFCGTGCNNHFIGSGECGDNVTQLGGSNTYDEKALKAWGDICAQTGAELWFWYYPVTYHYYLVGCPNIFNIYEDFRYLVNECNVTGIYYEGGGRTYNFETLKAYLASRVIVDPDMTEEEFIDLMKEYLYMYYGDGYEELYQYIVMQNEAGDGAGCFINNYDRPRQMYDYVYIDEHYEKMRALLVEARAKAKTQEQIDRIDTLIVCCDFLGLTCVHYRYYEDEGGATQETKELYMERYDNMYNYIVSHDMDIFSDQSENAVYKIPGSISYTEDPMYQFYGEERDGVTRYP